MTEFRKRLIEVAFPLKEVSAHSRREKNIRHGHISTLHIWWARRPLAACRAFIYASLVDDPETDQEREELLREVADIASWDAVRHPERVVRSPEDGGSGLTGEKLLVRARQRILDCNDGKPPRLIDPFAGGGAIPLEGLRLGCDVEASDLNPVAVLILKATVEYPQKYGRSLSEQVEQKRRGEREDTAGVASEVPQYIIDAASSRDGDQASFFDGDLIGAYRKNPLATDVRYWGNWVLERAREELAEFYPPDPDGRVPVTYLWSRTVPCPNCDAEMPLIRQYWLARKAKKKVALKPVIDRGSNRVDFEVVEGEDVTGNPAEATTSRGDTVCLLCHQVVKASYVRGAGQQGKIGAVLTAAVIEGTRGRGKTYRADTVRDLESYQAAAKRLDELERNDDGELSLAPDEPINRETLGLRVDAYGLTRWRDLFNARQLLTMTTFSALASDASGRMASAGLSESYTRALCGYLGLIVDRIADRGSTLCRWDSPYTKVANTFARQTLSFIWDYAETCPLAGSSGSAAGAINWVAEVAESIAFDVVGTVKQADAREAANGNTCAITDPPYYDAVDYAGLSDFFYVWLKRSTGDLHRDLFALPLTPKNEQAIMASESGDDTARDRYVTLMAQAFHSLSRSVQSDGVVGVVFAHTNPDAWSTLIQGLIAARLVPDASWPIDTELENKIHRRGRALLTTSVWMACRPRDVETGEAFIGDVLSEMGPVVRERLLYFWSKGIRGADFFISAIGPALSVFGKHNRVLRPDGSVVTVRDFLDLVRKESTEVALEQVLSGADLGVVDPATRHYVTWVWSYSRAPLDAGETIALCLATGADYKEIVKPGSIAAEAKEKSKKVVKLRTIRERGTKDEHLGIDTPARSAPLIEQLQRAAYLWSQNKPDELAAYRGSLGETRWQALRTLGQAVVECLPDEDEDRRLVNGLLGSNVMGAESRVPGEAKREKPATAGAQLPGFDEEGEE